MSTVTVTNKTEDKPAEIKAGQYYRDISEHGGQSLYIVAKIDDDFILVDAENGRSYMRTPMKREDIFGNDQEDFVLVPNVEIILS